MPAGIAARRTVAARQMWGRGRSHSVRVLGPHPVSWTRTENSMDKPARARLRLLALFLPLTAVLYIAAEALDPKGTDQLISTTAVAFGVLPIAARHPAQLYVSGSLTIAALGALAVSYAAIAALVRGRGWVTATAAALLGGAGAFCGAIVNVLVGVNLAAAAPAHMTHDAAAQFLVTSFSSTSSQVFSYLYFFTEYTAPVVMG